MERLPEQVQIGMKVFDSEGRHVGKVDDLKFPENAVAPEVEPADVGGERYEPADNPVIEAVADAFGREDIPEPLRSQLLRDGYVHLDAAGLFAADRFVLPEQIARVDPDGLYLNVTTDALIKKPN